MNKRMDRGFTLIELLAVVTLIALISLIAIPNITKNVKDKKIEISEANQKILTAATDTYIQNNQLKYNYNQEADGSTYCIPIQNLIDDGILQAPFKDVNGQEIDYSAQVKATYQSQYNSFEYELVERDGCQEIIQYVSRPQLAENMIPVIYDETGNTWKKANKNSYWYNYSEKRWANAVLVRKTKSSEQDSKDRREYIEAPAGTTILESDILAQFVWIPRFRYQIFDSETTEQINIVFENSVTTKSNGTTEGQWLTHPAFTYNNEELSGIWIGKYESSNSSNEIIIKDNTTPCTDISFNDAKEKAKSIVYENNIYGLNKMNSHLMRNSEWGAVAYLSNSIYGNLENDSITGNIYGIYNTTGNNEYVEIDNQYVNSLGYALDETKNWATNKTYVQNSNKNITRGNTTIFDYLNAGEKDSSATFRIALYNTENQGPLFNNPPCIDGLTEINEYVDFAYTGDVQTFEACAGRIYKLEVWGAQGGNSYSSTSAGGKGGYSKGTLSLERGETLYIYTGGQGKIGESSKIVNGGFNGGGNSSYYYGGSGGGASDIRIGSTSLYSRVIVAGGGGGGAYYSSSYTGGAGGGTTGIDSSGYSTSYTAKAGTQTAGGVAGGYSGYQGTEGSFGLGGNANTDSTSYNRSGGGGGGWYGGGGGGYRSSSSYYYYGNSGGGGGSGYVYTSSTAANYPSEGLLNSKYYLKNATTSAGNTSFTSPTGTNETGHSGDGYVRITYVGQVVTNTSGCNDGILALNDSIDFDYTGDVQEFNACAGRKYKLEVWGAQGGSCAYNVTGCYGGTGGYTTGQIVFSQATQLYVYVGGKGLTGSTNSSVLYGGYNGGGPAGGSYSSSYNTNGGSGGGASDIRIGTDSLYSRVIVAGGGGGGAASTDSSCNNTSSVSIGGKGGGTSGGTPNGTRIGSPGTQTSGGAVSSTNGTNGTNGSFGTGGTAAYNSNKNTGGGGGGGWYGGGGGGHGSDCTTGAGGGGSGYVYTSSTASNYPSGCLLTSEYYLDNASTAAGNTTFTSPEGTSETGHTGDGFARITYIE